MALQNDFISIFEERTALFRKNWNLYSIFPLFVGKNLSSMANGMTRLDLRISQKQKSAFEQALDLGGFRSLTDFLISAAAEKAEAIMEAHNNWLASENDRKVFFNALLNPPAPNDRLKAAMRKHSEFKMKK